MARELPPLDGLDLNLLVTLRALLREQSVTRAAALLRQTQPTVSRALAQLRTAFDDPLLVRSGRGMAPTPLAQSLRTPLERSLASLDRLRAVGAFDPATDQRIFRLTVPDLLGALLVPPLVERICQEAPGVSLQILGSERDAVRSLLDDEVDLVVGAPELDHPELYTRSLGRAIGWSVLYGPRHPAWDGEMDRALWLASEHVQLAPAGRPDAPSPMETLLASQGMTRVIRLHLGYLSGLGQTLARAPYVMSLPTPIALQVARAAGLRVAPHPLGELMRPLPLRMSWHRIHHADPGLAWMRGLLVDAFAASLG